MNTAQRQKIAEILETVARDGLPGPRDLDVALDAIGGIMKGKDDDFDEGEVFPEDESEDAMDASLDPHGPWGAP